MEQRVGHRLGLLKHFFHPVCVCAVIQQVHHSPVIWHRGNAATSLMKRRCTSARQQFLWRHSNSFFFFLSKDQKLQLFLDHCIDCKTVLRGGNTREVHLHSSKFCLTELQWFVINNLFPRGKTNHRLKSLGRWTARLLRLSTKAANSGAPPWWWSTRGTSEVHLKINNQGENK